MALPDHSSIVCTGSSTLCCRSTGSPDVWALHQDCHVQRGVTLVKGELAGIARAIALSRETMSNIHTRARNAGPRDIW